MWVQEQKVSFFVIQSKPQDLSKTLINVTVVRYVLEINCKTTNQSFKENIYNVTKLALISGVEISMLRTCGR